MKFNDLTLTRPPCRETRTMESVEYFDTLAVLKRISGRSSGRPGVVGPQKTAADRAPRHICTAHELQHVASLQCFGLLARVLLMYIHQRRSRTLGKQASQGNRQKKCRVRNKSNSPDTERTI